MIGWLFGLGWMQYNVLVVETGVSVVCANVNVLLFNQPRTNQLTINSVFCFCFATDGIYIQQRLYRESCLAVEGNFLKDLNVLGRDLSKTILVDNSPHAFGYQVDNGIPIESWFEDPSDRELLKLRNFLLNKVYGTDDVRPILRSKFQCQQLVDEAPAFYMEG